MDNNNQSKNAEKPAFLDSFENEPNLSQAPENEEAATFTALNEGTIKTDIDDLLNLISEKKEISMGDAAKALDVPPQTIEAWSIFLEEDGVIEVRYKLTTPYLVAKDKKLAQAAIRNKVEEIQKDTTNQILLKDNKTLPKEMESPIKDKSKKPIPKKEVFDNIKVPQLFKEASKDLNELFNTAYKLIQEGRFEEANKIYEQIKQENDTLPTGLKEFKRDISINLTKLNKDLIIHIEKYNLRASSELSKYITGKLARLSRQVEIGEIKAAEDTYVDIQSALSAYPAGFESRKADLQASVIEVYKKLLAKKRILINKYNTDKILQIRKVIGEIKSAISSKQMDLASKKYDEARQLYTELPEGFAEENETITNELFSLVPQIITGRKKYSSEEFSTQSTKLKTLISATYESLRQNKIEVAERRFSEIKEIYSILPKEFFAKRADLEAEILELEHQLLIRSKASSVITLREATSNIMSLLKTARDYINRNNVELAEGVYYELLYAYRQIPEGFLEQKTLLGVEVLNIFREIILKYDEELLRGTDEKTSSTYQRIIHLLTTLRKDIEEEKLDAIEHKFSEITELFGHLPFRFVQENTKLWREIQLVSSEIELFQKARLLPGYKDNISSLTTLLGEIRKGYLQLNAQFQDFPDYSKLLTFVKDNYLFYYNLSNRTNLKEIPPDSTLKAPQLPPRIMMGTDFAQDRVPKPEPREEGPFLPPLEISRQAISKGSENEALHIGTIRVAPRIEMPSVDHKEPSLSDIYYSPSELSDETLHLSDGQAQDEPNVSGEPSPSGPSQSDTTIPQKVVVEDIGDEHISGKTESSKIRPQEKTPLEKQMPKVIFAEPKKKSGTKKQAKFISDYLTEQETIHTPLKQVVAPQSESAPKKRGKNAYVVKAKQDLKEEPSQRQTPGRRPEPISEEITPAKLRENLIKNLIEAGDGRMKLGKFDDAEKTYRQALAFDGFNKEAREKLNELEKLKAEAASGFQIEPLPEKDVPKIGAIPGQPKKPIDTEINLLTSELESFEQLVKSEIEEISSPKAAAGQKAPFTGK